MAWLESEKRSSLSTSKLDLLLSWLLIKMTSIKKSSIANAICKWFHKVVNERGGEGVDQQDGGLAGVRWNKWRPNSRYGSPAHHSLCQPPFMSPSSSPCVCPFLSSTGPPAYTDNVKGSSMCMCVCITVLHSWYCFCLLLALGSIECKRAAGRSKTRRAGNICVFHLNCF